MSLNHGIYLHFIPAMRYAAKNLRKRQLHVRSILTFPIIKYIISTTYRYSIITVSFSFILANISLINVTIKIRFVTSYANAETFGNQNGFIYETNAVLRYFSIRIIYELIRPLHD